MAGWLLHFTGVVRAPMIATRGDLINEAHELAELDALPLVGADRVGRFVAELPGLGARRLPPDYLPPAVISAAGGTLIARYVNGMRGNLTETGFHAEPLTPEAWKRAGRGLPELSTQDEIDAWLERVEGACQ